VIGSNWIADPGHALASRFVNRCRTIDTDQTDVTHRAEPPLITHLVSMTLSGSHFVPIMASRVQ
jgi:hypothetical protein